MLSPTTLVSSLVQIVTIFKMSVRKVPSLSTGSAMPLTGTVTVQERPLLSLEGETRLPDSSYNFKALVEFEPRCIAVVSKICINTGIPVIIVKNASHN